MPAAKNIRKAIVHAVHQVVPDAKMLLYGSRARGDFREDSDWDVLVLLDKDKVSSEVRGRIYDSIYELELICGQQINPAIYTQKFWDTTRFTPYHQNVEHDAIELR